MASAPDAERKEEPQAERGAKGSRDTGSAHPSGGPSDRPSGTGDAKSDTSIRPRKSADPDAPDLQSGGG
ncbi:MULTISPECIES: hypothetical protein [unclassified Streptomyces]|uniref:hypothetical protein n=1 Tax=unclassified Streptomyces TaxID=2593676 RepID=UPI00324F04FD